MAAEKFYAIARGRKQGVFKTTWAQAKTLVEGFNGARYKGFKSQTEAQAWLAEQQTTRPKTGAKTSSTAPVRHQADTIYLYTDGGSRNTGNVNGQHVKVGDKAAWAYLIQYNDQEMSDSAGEFGATNNKMEITALLEGLRYIAQTWPVTTPIVVIADSQYVLNAITKHWLAGWQRKGWTRGSGKPLANKELWQALAQLLPRFSQISYRWTKGHATNHGNVFVDHALNQTMDAMAANNPSGRQESVSGEQIAKSAKPVKSVAKSQRPSPESMASIRKTLKEMGYLQHKSESENN
ncbi:ribonuclease H family protein [Loigolactobacillus backii]|uniref:ribonuclease H family protein n=1 Tax=Loigolactobacillus backii TaxID=375175 RepID=UPI000C1CBB8F|nr:ribonuclease H family protein [Loigolactobacillus backii]MDA5388501.1 ribonuclease H family protein [Loigolactobacillus backii]MDA5390975.1 ribonuclease H family protein [Loigolactobacillus backii]PIO82251.1 ribonuclease [Loigolactobacillus backii]